MQQLSLQRYRVAMVGLALAFSTACAAEEDDDMDADTSGSGPTTTSTTATSTTASSDATSATTSNTTAADDAPSDEDTSSAETTDGGEEDEGDTTDDGGATEDTGAAGSTIIGTVSRSGAAPIAGGNDGIGTFYVGLLAECSQDAMSFGGNGVMVDVSAQDTPANWEVPNVPDGHYFLAGFLDDNGNADPMDPYADMGDLADAEGFGPACLEVTVAGADVGAGQFVLDIQVPF